jgi:hypothetical protein
MLKFAKAVKRVFYPEVPPEPEVITWDLPIEEIQRVIWAYARRMRCTYDKAISKLCYMSYRDAKEFLDES